MSRDGEGEAGPQAHEPRLPPERKPLTVNRAPRMVTKVTRLGAGRAGLAATFPSLGLAPSTPRRGL
jgi:hypothetical protein